MYECEILADSIGPSGKRLTTLVLTGFWKLLQAELNTHRWFSRNSASSRAIPSEKLRQRIIADPFMPIFWGKNEPGMQARAELDDFPTEVVHPDGPGDLRRSYVHESPRSKAKKLWLEARDKALETTLILGGIGLHKQLCNRLLEPWMSTSIIISATEWDGFFKQRRHPDAQPEFGAAAEAIYNAMAASRPEPLAYGEWHLPLVREEDFAASPALPESQLIKLSVARCARVSYLTHDGRRDPKADFELYDRLTASGHWSPLEHAAKALSTPARVGNFIGWQQHRADVDPNYVR